MLLDFTNIAQPNIPISTAAPTHHVRFATHTLSYTFFKNIFSIFWCPFPGPRSYCPPFSNSPTPATYPQIFSQLSTSILTSFFTVLPNGLTARSYVLLALHQGVPNPWARAIHGPHSPLDAVEPNLHRHPYAPPLFVL